MKVGAVKPIKAYKSRTSRLDMPCNNLLRLNSATKYLRVSYSPSASSCTWLVYSTFLLLCKFYVLRICLNFSHKANDRHYMRNLMHFLEEESP